MQKSTAFHLHDGEGKKKEHKKKKIKIPQGLDVAMGPQRRSSLSPEAPPLTGKLEQRLLVHAGHQGHSPEKGRGIHLLDRRITKDR